MSVFIFNFDDVQETEPTRSGNKGEWSEVYTMFKLLNEGKLYSGDENYKKINDRFYPIISIIREEIIKNQPSELYDYEIVRKDNDYTSEVDYVIIKLDGVELLKMSAESFLNAANHLLMLIKNGKGRSFTTSSINEAFMEKAHLRNVKRDPGHKADIELNLYDTVAPTNWVMGMSIKSLIGEPPTLFNTSDATLITYLVEGVEFSDDEIYEINSIDGYAKLKKRIAAIKEKGARIEYEDFENEIFKNNLDLIDFGLPKILAEAVLAYFSASRISSSNDIVNIIAASNPLKSKYKDPYKYYKAKFTRFLEASALGMYPATPYDDSNDAKGYIIVKDDGDIVCYSFYDREMARKHLFDNTKFDTPDSNKDGRKDFCKLYRTEDGKVHIQLNFQIRWK